MSNPELHFKDKKELLGWFEKNIPESYTEYFETIKRIRESGFSGSARLLNREKFDETIENFLAFQTELNLANLFLRKGISDLEYEPKGIKGVDFSFDKIFLSVKSLNTKDYEGVEHDEIKRMEKDGGGKNTLSHKGFSSTDLEVERNSMGTFTQTRTEIGSANGVLDSDISQMSPPLKYMALFEEQSNKDGVKKVMFIFPYSSQFRPYHAIDIARWYFDLPPNGYQWIFQGNMDWYLKLFGKKEKQKTIDALVFMFPPNPMIWPEDCFGQEINKQKRVQIYTRDQELYKQLKSIFS